MFRKKSLLIVGGSGKLGSETVKKFVGGPWYRKWKVFNIDQKANPVATENFIIDPSQPITQEIVEELHGELKKFDDEFEAIINTAGHYYPPNSRAYQLHLKREAEEGGRDVPEDTKLLHSMMISNPACFEEYEKIKRSEFLSTMLCVHLTEKFLSPTGYFLLVGNSPTLHGLSKETTPLENMAKSVVMQQAMNLSVQKIKEGLVYENAVINVYTCNRLAQEVNFKWLPYLNKKKDFLDMELVANMFKFFSRGENRPLNGTHFELEVFDKKGKILMPRYWN